MSNPGSSAIKYLSFSPPRRSSAPTTMTRSRRSNVRWSVPFSHFHEKLLKLKDTMKTEEGRKMAEKRCVFHSETPRDREPAFTPDVGRH